jgi:hypothetical protein
VAIGQMVTLLPAGRDVVTSDRSRCHDSRVTMSPFGVEPPKPRIEAVRVVDMTSSNAWAEFAALFLRTRTAHLEHEHAKAELKSLVPEMRSKRLARAFEPNAQNREQLASTSSL